jgi:hypothetical protein
MFYTVHGACSQRIRARFLIGSHDPCVARKSMRFGNGGRSGWYGAIGCRCTGRPTEENGRTGKYVSVTDARVSDVTTRSGRVLRFSSLPGGPPPPSRHVSLLQTIISLRRHLCIIVVMR